MPGRTPRRSQGFRIFDALYGDVTLPPVIADLLSSPAVQRLRDIRLSNIDSLAMPGIANITRYEHAIGSSYLASRLPFCRKLSEELAIALQSAALLHDVTISAFGHLAEEAFAYAGYQFDHETKLSQLLLRTSEELGGIELQLYLNRESGITAWADRSFGTTAQQQLRTITEALRGDGILGSCISNDIDVDNLDNLVRIAFHMGLEVERDLPLRIAGTIVDVSEVGTMFDDRASPLIAKWLELRHRVYTRLMLSRTDFIAKAMLLYAIVLSCQRELLGPLDYAWRFTDRELVASLRQAAADDRDVARAIDPWLLHDFWPLSDLLWFRGPAPDFAKLIEFNAAASAALHRPLFAYRIADKRTRQISINTTSGQRHKIGSKPDRWVLGVASVKREPFSSIDNLLVQRVASDIFSSECLGEADYPHEYELTLFQ